MAENSFADMLLPGEAIAGQLAGEGRAVERGQGVERTWWHIALTNQRLLVIRMHQPPKTDRWDVIARLATARENARFAHYPRTRGDTARLTVDGCGDRAVLVDVDRPPLLQQVKSFLDVWGGPVAGGSVATEEDDSHNDQSGGDQKMFLYVAGAMLGLFALCCGGTLVLGILRFLLGLLYTMFLG